MMADDDLWTHLHVMLENQAVDMRDHGVSLLGVANGMVVKYRDGTPSSAIRIPTRSVVQRVVEEYRRLRDAGEAS